VTFFGSSKNIPGMTLTTPEKTEMQEADQSVSANFLFDPARDRPKTVSPLRQALSENIGAVLTPEVAADIEMRATRAATLFARAKKIDRLAHSMIGHPQPELVVKHYFSPGIYAREITIPKDVVLVGAVHRLQNMAIVMKGSLRLVTETGTVLVKAGDPPVNCNANRENAAWALEETVWINFFPNPNNETDPDKLVEMVAYIKASEIVGGKDNVQIKALKKLAEEGEGL
jgi:hypothetical protein